MRKFVTAVLLLVLLTQATTALAYPILPTEGIVRVNAYLRKEPTVDSHAFVTVEKDTSVTIMDIVNDWMYVQHGLSKGYIRGDLFYDTTKMDSGPSLVVASKSGQISSWLPSVLLRYGMRGQDVKRLQEALAALGYSDLEIDGVFSKKTENMVKAFQENYGLKSDGIAGEQTITMLNEALDYYNQKN